MKKETLSDSVGNARDEYIEAAGRPVKKTAAAKKAVAAVLLVAVAAAAVLGIPRLPGLKGPKPGTETTHGTAEEDTKTDGEQESATDFPSVSPTPETADYAVISAAYPDLTALGPYEAAQAKETALGMKEADYRGLSPNWYLKTLPQFLKTRGDENAAFSPLNMLINLAALAEISGGGTRAQILELLDVPDVPTLRAAVKSIWLKAYQNSDYLYGDKNFPQETKLIPATSFWLNKNVALSGDTEIAEVLKNDYYTSFFKGDPDDPAYSEALRAWINEATGGLLADAMREEKFDPQTLFKLVSTLYLKAAWGKPFAEENNFTAPFHAPGGDRTAEYMRAEDESGVSCFETDDFIAVSKGTRVGQMWFLLPKDSKTPADLLESGAYAALLEEYGKAPEARFQPPEGYDLYVVSFTLPKFDVSDSFDLKEELTALGLTDLFDPAKAEIPFLKLKDGGRVFFTGGSQDVRVAIDEQGVSAASAIRMDGGYGDPVFKHVDFVADRPFLYLIVAGDGLPCFAGVVNSVG